MIIYNYVWKYEPLYLAMMVICYEWLLLYECTISDYIHILCYIIFVLICASNLTSKYNLVWKSFSLSSARCYKSSACWENSYSISFQIEWDMIVVTVFLSILNQMDFHLVQKSKGKLSPRSYPIQCERKWNTSFVSVIYYIKSHSPATVQEKPQRSDV